MSDLVTRGGAEPLHICVHAVVCVYLLRGLGKPFSRMFSEPQRSGQSHHGLQELENVLSFGESIFIEEGHPAGL